jgi:hypothetical protein
MIQVKLKKPLSNINLFTGELKEPDLTYDEIYDVVEETSFLIKIFRIVNNFGQIKSYDADWFVVVNE